MPKNTGNTRPKAPRTTFNVIPEVPPRQPDGGDFKSDGSIGWPQFRAMLLNDIAANRAELRRLRDMARIGRSALTANRIGVLQGRVASAKKTLRRYGEEVADDDLDRGVQ